MLGTPLTLPCGSVLRNRLAKAAMSERLAGADRRPTERHVHLYRTWARGRLGLQLTGNVMVDPGRLGEPGNVAMTDGDDALLRAWASAATEDGTAAWVQLNHPGRQSPRALDRAPVAPSAVAMTGTWGAFARPRALEPDEIEGVIAAFATAAARVVQAGFGGVQIHAAHGYLVSQFLSPLTNTRTDRWGGDLTGRMRFLLELVRAVRAAIGPAAPLSVKLNTADFLPGGFDTDEAVEVAAALEGEHIDLLELSGGTYERSAMFDEARPSTRAREGMFLQRAERIRARVSTPLMVTGGFRTRDGMEAALDAGIDVVGLARPLAVEPDLAARLLSGEATEAVPVSLRTGLAALDGLVTGSWYQVQLERLAAGLPADPSGSRWAAVARYVRDLVSPSGRGAR